MSASDDIAVISGRINAVYDYTDAVGCWFRNPLSEKQLRFLNDNCGSIRRAGKRRGDINVSEPAWWDYRYRQVLRIYQPNAKAIEFLAQRDDILLNYFELARDLILPDEQDVQELMKLTTRHFVQRWHRKRQVTVFFSGNYRTGRLHQKGTVFQFYGDKPQRETGEYCCFHMEAKVTGSAALTRMGIEHPRNLIGFSADAFWNHNLVYLDVDRRRLPGLRQQKQSQQGA